MPRDPHPDRPGLSRGPTPPRTLTRAQGLVRNDLALFVATLGVCLVGALLVWSATHRTAGTAYLVRHLLNTAIGVGLALTVTRLGRVRIRWGGWWVYVAAVLGLVAVLTPIGTTINGSRSWIPVVAGFTIQPSEFAKVGIILVLAGLFAARLDRRLPPSTTDLGWAWLLVLVPVGLVMLQPDLGSAVVLLVIGFVTIMVAGAPWRWVAGVAALGVAGIVAILTTGVLSAYQKDRLLVFLDPERDPLGAGYQLSQVRLAIGSGGWWGQGFMEGRQTQGGFIPYQLNDFIFSVAGEELGFIGSVGLLGLLGFVVVRIVLVGARSGDAFGRFVGAGVGAWFAVQIFQNVGMNLGLLPVTGLPLPFVSYGGSSMFAAWIAVGIVNAAYDAEAPRPLLR